MQLIHNITPIKMKKFLPLALILILFSCKKNEDDIIPPVKNPPNGSTIPINSGNCGATGYTDLIAGQHTVIGRVRVQTDGTTLTVVYEINQPDWGITETHLSVKGVWTEIPQTKTGNPIPGQFEFKNNHNKVIGFPYFVDVSAFSQVSIAAHCKVVKLSGVNTNSIPGLVPGQTFQLNPQITPTQSNISSFVNINLSGNPVGSGSYDGFCVDHGTQLSSNLTYTVFTIDPFVANEDTLTCMGIDRPENFDLVAYIINRYYNNAYSNAQGEELQAAIWTLLEPAGPPPTSTLISWDQSVVNTILADAANGENFLPGLCDYRFLLLDLHCSQAVSGAPHPHQTIIPIIAPQECNIAGEETAWGFGPQFPGANWGMYFNYCVR